MYDVLTIILCCRCSIITDSLPDSHTYAVGDMSRYWIWIPHEKNMKICQYKYIARCFILDLHKKWVYECVILLREVGTCGKDRLSKNNFFIQIHKSDFGILFVKMCAAAKLFLWRWQCLSHVVNLNLKGQKYSETGSLRLLRDDKKMSISEKITKYRTTEKNYFFG